MLHRGRVVLFGSLDEIKAKYRQFTLHFETALSKAPVIAGALSVCGQGKEWKVMCNGERNDLPAVAGKLAARVVDEHAPSFNEIFVAHAGDAAFK
jgi:ABC-2 type transport system ATP-binding protein